MSMMLGVDLGGTAIKSALVDSFGVVSDRRSTPTPQQDPTGEASISALATLVASYQQTAGVLGVGLAIPGLVDPEKGIAIFSGTLGWRNLSIVEKLAQLIEIPVTLEHDVTAIGFAESRVGVAKDFQSAVVVAIGTALAASVILNGSVYHPHPAVGELGHTPTKNSRPCVCGLNGCLEMTASGGGLSRNYKALTGETVSAIEIFDRAQGNDEDAKALVEEFVDVLGTSFVFVSALLGPEVIVLAGGVAQAGNGLITKLEADLDKKLTILKKPKLLQSNLDAGAGSLGAGLIAWERLA